MRIDTCVIGMGTYIEIAISQPDGIESPVLQQLHVLFNKAPVRIKFILSRDPRRPLHHHINTVEIFFPPIAVHKLMSGRVDMNAARPRVSKSETVSAQSHSLICQLIIQVFEKSLSSLHVRTTDSEVATA